jgi:hypothetical protein
MASKRNSEKHVVAPSGTAAVPVRRKSVSTKRTPHTTVEVSSTQGSETEVLTAAASAPVALAAVSAESQRDAVARLAYSYWEALGRQGGSPEADWLRAEQEISAR